MLATIQNWIGKIVDYDKAYGYQCIDLCRQFAKDMGNPIGTFSGSALNGWLTGSPFVGTKWERVTNTTTAIPKEGDIVFLDKTASNPYGHVAVAGEGCTGSKLVLIEQNAGTGNGDGKNGNKITMRTIKYNDPKRGICLGWYTMPVKNTIPKLEEDISLLNAEERIYREEVIRTGIQGVFIDHKGDEPITKGQVKSLIDTAVVRIIERLSK